MEYRISELHPNVDHIEIEYRIEHKSPITVPEVKGKAEYGGESLPEFDFLCPNRECTCGHISLYSEVASMLAHSQKDRSGEKRCEGSEATDHPEQCASVLHYRIHVSYRSTDHRQV